MLRRATLEDADALSALASTCFTQTFGHLYAPDDLDRFIHEAYSPEVLRAELADPKRPTWLLFEELSMDATPRSRRATGKYNACICCRATKVEGAVPGCLNMR